MYFRIMKVTNVIKLKVAALRTPNHPCRSIYTNATVKVYQIIFTRTKESVKKFSFDHRFNRS